MRRFFRTAVGKTLLFILTILFGAATLASIAGIVVMVSEDMYSRTEGQVYDDLLGNMIIQDGRLVGAVTHVLINDPTNGYGIFIENMLQNSIKIN